MLCPDGHDVPVPNRFCGVCGKPVPAGSSPAADPIRARLEEKLGDRYRVVRLLGRGGMGSVYLARELHLDREVAVKVLPPGMGGDEKARERFRREARTAARLNHPNIVPLHAFGDDDDMMYLVMGYVRGESLGARLERDTRIPAAGNAVGTPQYVSPEHVGGKPDIDGRSDLYSLGVMAYRMVAGRLPFEGTGPADILVQHLTRPPAPLTSCAPDVSHAFASAVERCLEKEPGRRWPDGRTPARGHRRSIGTPERLDVTLAPWSGQSDSVGSQRYDQPPRDCLFGGLAPGAGRRGTAPPTRRPAAATADDLVGDDALPAAPARQARCPQADPLEDKKALEDLACYLVRSALSLQKFVYLEPCSTRHHRRLGQSHPQGPSKGDVEGTPGRGVDGLILVAGGSNMLPMTEIAPRIVADEGIRFGRPVIKGTRVPVDLVVGKLAGGMTVEQVAEEYALEREDVLAALRYAAEAVAGEQVRPVR